ncbi:MAG: peptidase, partial [Caulobacteraceae bacterium]|nr:peptidase [Caulobacteraceae bacterium]
MKTLVSTLAILAAVPGLAHAAASPSPITISIGQTLSGALEASDATWSDGSHYDLYRFHATAGQKIRIEMNTPANVLTDDYLTLEKAGGDGKTFLASDDDGADAPLDALIVYTIPDTGDYDIRASGVKKDDLGVYTLSVWLDGGAKPAVGAAAPSKPTAGASTSSGSSQSDDTVKMMRPTRTSPINIGQTIDGVLATGDQKDDAGFYVDSYTLAGKKGANLLISAHSGEFDTVLDLSEANSLDQLVMDDDITTGTDSTIQIQLPDDGTYTIEITAQGRDGRNDGAYTLNVKTDPAPLTEDE